MFVVVFLSLIIFFLFLQVPPELTLTLNPIIDKSRRTYAQYHRTLYLTDEEKC